MAKQKREKLWKDGMWRLDDDCGCHCCYWYYTGVVGDESCNASGKRFENGYCNCFRPRLEKGNYDEQTEYETYMENWN